MGVGSGKSWAIVDYLIVKMVQNQNLNLVCLRQIQKSIKYSSKKLLEDRIEHLGLNSYFQILQTEIRMMRGNGIVIFQGLQDHTADSIKSLEGFDMAFVEEAQNITEHSLELLIPTIRKEDSELLFSWNPRHPFDPIEQLFKQKDNSVLIHSTYKDNKYCPQVIVDEALEMEEDDFNKYQHIYLGTHIMDDDNTIIKMSWIEAAIDSHITLGIEPTGAYRIGYDIADSGDDSCATIETHGKIGRAHV